MIKKLNWPLLAAAITLSAPASAALVTTNFSWSGTGVGLYTGENFSASGSFVYDDSLALVEAEGSSYGNFNSGLDSLSINFFNDTTGNLLFSTDAVSSGGINNYSYLEFHFDTSTQEIISFFDIGDSGNTIYDHYIAGEVGASSWLVEDDSLDDLASNINTHFTVSAVPVPASVWLFASGLLGVAGVARRKKNH